jgi:hypothetical protein
MPNHLASVPGGTRRSPSWKRAYNRFRISSGVIGGNLSIESGVSFA